MNKEVVSVYISKRVENREFQRILSMSTTVAHSVEDFSEFRIVVNADLKLGGKLPFFMYTRGRRPDRDTPTTSFSIKEARLVFPEGIKHWKPLQFDVEELVSYLRRPYPRDRRFSNWQYLIFTWNWEYGVFFNKKLPPEYNENEMEAFFDGFYDVPENLRNPHYVSYIQEQPDYLLIGFEK